MVKLTQDFYLRSDIRNSHVTDSTTADTTGSSIVADAIEPVRSFKGSPEKAKVAMVLDQLGIKYNKITTEEFVVLMRILRKSDLLNPQGSKRGKSGHNLRPHQINLLIILAHN